MALGSSACVSQNNLLLFGYAMMVVAVRMRPAHYLLLALLSLLFTVGWRTTFWDQVPPPDRPKVIVQEARPAAAASPPPHRRRRAPPMVSHGLRTLRRPGVRPDTPHRACACVQ